MTTTATNAAAASASATTAIAMAQASSSVAVARPATKLTLAFADKHGVFDIATCEGLALSVPRIKGEQGSFFKGEEDLGDKIRIEIISVSPRWTIGTGTDDKESKDFVRFSYDGQTISGQKDGGVLVSDYLDSLKAQGFSKAHKSEYLDVFCFVTWTAKGGDIAADARELCLLQCSPTSKGAFVAFTTTRGLLESRGMAQPLDIVEVHAEKRVSGSNKYTNFSFHAPKA